NRNTTLSQMLHDQPANSDCADNGKKHQHGSARNFSGRALLFQPSFDSPQNFHLSQPLFIIFKICLTQNLKNCISWQPASLLPSSPPFTLWTIKKAGTCHSLPRNR